MSDKKKCEDYEVFLCINVIKKDYISKKTGEHKTFYKCKRDGKSCSPKSVMFGYDCYERMDVIEGGIFKCQ